MQECKSRDTPVAKGDKFSLKQCPKGNLEIQEMQKIPYASAIGSLMYAQVCTRPDIAYIVGGWVIRQIFKQSRNGSLESSQKSYEVFEENKVLYAHIQEVRSISWRSLDILTQILQDA